MKKKAAIFTIVKNEKYFLPKWIKHYKKFFNSSDIYILDHDTDDGSTNNLDVNVEKLDYKIHFDHFWLIEVIQNKQKKLLESYDCVIFAESDELIYCPDRNLKDVIDEFINNLDCSFITCTAYELKQNNTETQLSPEEDIFKKRNYWFRTPTYDKTLITKIPLKYGPGFHSCDYIQKNFYYNVKLCHLHRCDIELMIQRHIERATKWNLKDDGAAGYQHKIVNKEEIINYFNNIEGQLELIPEIDKNALYES